MASSEIVIIGGGIVGCMTALELTKRGHQVKIIERNQIAAQTSGESSWAGAGIIFPLLPWMYGKEVNQLALTGGRLYQKLAGELKTNTGIDPEYIQSGMLILPDYDQNTALAWCDQYQIPFLQTEQGLLLPNVAQIKPPSLLKSLKQYLLQLGVVLIEQTQLLPIDEAALTNAGYIDQLQATSGEYFNADLFIVTSGAWSFELLKNTALKLDIKPMRGQILLYQLPVNSLPHIVYKNGFYLLQRQNGYLLAGSSLEDVGFDSGVTEAMRRQMQMKAEAIMPELIGAPIIQHWSGLRPGTPNNVPTIAAHPTIQNLYLNTGHFRYGLTMAPESATRLADLIQYL